MFSRRSVHAPPPHSTLMYKHPPSGAASQSAALLTPHSYPYPYTLPPLPYPCYEPAIVVQKNKSPNATSRRRPHKYSLLSLCNDVKRARGTAMQLSREPAPPKCKVMITYPFVIVVPPPKNKLPGALVRAQLVWRSGSRGGRGRQKKCGTNAPPPFLVSH